MPQYEVELILARQLAGGLAVPVVLFHHEPDHPDAVVDRLLGDARTLRPQGTADAASEGLTIEL